LPASEMDGHPRELSRYLPAESEESSSHILQEPL
jgi:hypothetical protein